MKAENLIRLNEIIIELEELGEKLESFQQDETDSSVEYELSMASSELVDVRAYLRNVINK